MDSDGALDLNLTSGQTVLHHKMPSGFLIARRWKLQDKNDTLTRSVLQNQTFSLQQWIITRQNVSTSEDSCPDHVNWRSAEGFDFGLLRVPKDVIKVWKTKNRYYKVSTRKRRGGNTSKTWMQWSRSSRSGKSRRVRKPIVDWIPRFWVIPGSWSLGTFARLIL